MKTAEQTRLDMLLRGMLNVDACAAEIGIRSDAIYSLLSGRVVIVAEQCKAFADWSGETPSVVQGAFDARVANRQRAEGLRIAAGDYRTNVNAGRRRKTPAKAARKKRAGVRT